MNTSFRHFIAVALMVAFAGLRSANADPTKLQWEVDGVAREALVFIPASAKAEKAPLVFFFHGHGGNMNAVARNSNLQAAWPEAMLVYPQGLPTKTSVDPEGKRPGWQREPGELDDRDLKFFDAMLASLREKYPVNDQRIYAAGFSNGAAFTYVLWSQRGKVLAALAPCAGRTLPATHLEMPKPVLVVSGKADPLVKIDEALKLVADLKKLNGCSAEGKPWTVDGALLYPSEKHAPLVTFIHAGAHVMPAGAGEMIVKFFREHELEK